MLPCLHWETYLCILMESMKTRIEALTQEINATVPASKEELEAYRIKYLGTKGLVKEVFGGMKDVAAENKKEAGQILNAFKQYAEAHYEKYSHLLDSGNSNKKKEDLSLPGIDVPLGTRHPLRIVENKSVEIFERLGFGVAEGPEIEDDWHNFTSLNMPEDHTARDMQDTFYVSQNPDWLLRTHTSSVQARVLEEGHLPVRVICP